MFGFIIGVAVMIIDYQAVSGQTGCNPPNCHKVTITASNFISVDNNTYNTTGQAAWVTDGLTSGQCASVASIYPAWEAELGQDRAVSRIKIFWEDAQDDVYVSVGGRICHSAASTESTYTWTSEYTLVCGVPVTGNSLRIYRQPTVGMLNLSLCEVEIYATSESSSPPAFSASHGPTTSSTPATGISHGDTTSDVHATLSITLDSATTTIAPKPTTLSSTDIFTHHANPTTTIGLTTATTTSSTPTTPSSTDKSTSDTRPTSMNVLDTTTTSFLEASTPVMSNYEATRLPYFTTPEEQHESTSNHFLAPSSAVTPDTASTSANNSNPTNTQTYFTWPTSSLLSSQGSSSVFRSTPVNLSFHSLTSSEASTPYNALQNESMSPPTYMLTATTSLTAVSATTSTVNPASETNVPATFTGSVTSTPASTKTTSTTTLTSNGGTLTTTAEPDAAGTTPNLGQESSIEEAKTSNMNIVVIVAVMGGCVMLLYIVGITVFVLRQNRKARYSPGRAK